MAEYKLLNGYNEDGEIYQNVLKKSDEISIPFDPANRHYREYLEWVAEGNTPDPADEQKEDIVQLVKNKYPKPE